MGRPLTRPELEEKLTKFRALASRDFDSVRAETLRLAIEELEKQIHDFKD